VTVPLLARAAASPRTRALLLLWRSSRTLSVAALAFVIAEGALPVLVLIAMGRVTGAIPGAVDDGLSSPAGHRLIVSLAAAGAIYALSSCAARSRTRSPPRRRLGSTP
jgi:membrane protein implicated in regulation of membrane protease activity